MKSNGNETKSANLGSQLDAIIVNLTTGDSNGSIINGTKTRSLKILIGYDRQEDIAYEVCRYSLEKIDGSNQSFPHQAIGVEGEESLLEREGED